MNPLQAVVLGIVEGLTEFLPVSSTGHLTIVERLLGLRVDDAGVTAFTAIIQVGAIIAVIIYFRSDIVRLVGAWIRGLLHAEARRTQDWRTAWAVIIGTIPIGILGFLFEDQIQTVARNLWLIATTLIVFGLLLGLAE